MAKKSNKKYMWAIGLGLVVILIIWFATRKEKITEVETEKIIRKDLVAKVTESGTIQPKTELPIAPDVSGEVIDIRVKEGDFVKKGDLLFVIKPDNYQAALEQASASLNSSEADWSNAQSAIHQSYTSFIQDSTDLERYKGLLDKKVVSQVEFESAQLKYRLSKSKLEASKQQALSAKFRVESAKASVKQAQENLNKTAVYASMDGVITKLAMIKGQRVVGTGQMAGTEVIKIADLREMEVKVEINENDIVHIDLGDSASLTIDAYPDKIFKGQVTDKAYSATTSATTSTDQITNYTVKILINRESYSHDTEVMKNIASWQSPFRPGMSALVTIYTEKVEQALSLPIKSVAIDKELKNQAGKPQEIVYVLENNRVKKVPISSGITDDEFFEVKSGLKEGQMVVSGPLKTISDVLKDQMEVKILEKKPKHENELKKAKTLEKED